MWLIRILKQLHGYQIFIFFAWVCHGRIPIFKEPIQSEPRVKGNQAASQQQWNSMPPKRENDTHLHQGFPQENKTKCSSTWSPHKLVVFDFSWVELSCRYGFLLIFRWKFQRIFTMPTEIWLCSIWSANNNNNNNMFTSGPRKPLGKLQVSRLHHFCIQAFHVVINAIDPSLSCDWLLFFWWSFYWWLLFLDQIFGDFFDFLDMQIFNVPCKHPKNLTISNSKMPPFLEWKFHPSAKMCPAPLVFPSWAPWLHASAKRTHQVTTRWTGPTRHDIHKLDSAIRFWKLEGITWGPLEWGNIGKLLNMFERCRAQDA